MSGGFLATTALTVGTYLFGTALSATGWLAHAWANVTPGQASVIAFVFGFGFQVYRWRVERRDRRRAKSSN